MKKKVSLGSFIKDACCNWISDKCVGCTWNIRDNGSIGHYKIKKAPDVCLVTALSKPCEHFEKTLLPVALGRNWWQITDKYFKINPDSNPISKTEKKMPEYRSYKRSDKSQQASKAKRNGGKFA